MRARILAAFFAAVLWPALAFSQVTQGNLPTFGVDNTGQHIQDSGIAAARIAQGPISTVVGHLPIWDNTTGSLLKDFVGMGVVTGVTGGPDNMASWQAQATAAQAAGGGVLMVGPGQYGLTSGTITSGADIAWMFLPGAYISGGGLLDWEVDPTLINATNTSALTFGKLLSRAGSATPGSANQQGFVVQAVGPVTNSVASYQKDGIVSSVRQLDPSTALVSRDLAAIEGQLRLSVNNGRGWAQHGLTVIESGIQGLAFGAEFEINNASGIDADNHLDSATSQYVLHVDSIGANKVTAGIVLDGFAGKMFDGLIAKTTLGTKHFIGLVSDVVTDARPFAVDWTGALYTRALQFTASGAARGPVMISDSAYTTLISQSAAGQNGALTLYNSGTGAGTGETLIVATGTANNTLTITESDQFHSATILSGVGNTGGLQIEVLAGNLLLGTGIALATNTNSGHLQIPTMAGAPTGTNGALGGAALVWDSTNLKLWISTGGGTWKYVQGL